MRARLALILEVGTGPNRLLRVGLAVIADRDHRLVAAQPPPVRLPVQRRPRDPAPGGPALAGRRSAVSRLGLQLTAGSDPAIPLSAVTPCRFLTALLAVPKSPLQLVWLAVCLGCRGRGRPPPCVPVALGPVRPRLVAVRRADLRRQRPGRPLSRVRRDLLAADPARRAVRPGRARCRRPGRPPRPGSASLAAVDRRVQGVPGPALAVPRPPSTGRGTDRRRDRRRPSSR